MNEKIKCFFTGVGAVVSITVGFILSRLFKSNRQTINSDVGDGIEQARDTCSKTKGTIDAIRESTSESIGIGKSIADTNSELEQSIERSKSILSELKKRKHKE